MVHVTLFFRVGQVQNMSDVTPKHVPSAAVARGDIRRENVGTVLKTSELFIYVGAQDRDRWCAFVNAVMEPRASINCGEFLDQLRDF